MRRDSTTSDEPKRRTVLQSVSDSPESQKRRGFLRNALGAFVGSVGAAFGFSTRTSAMTPQEKRAAKAAAKEYNSTEAIRGVVQSYATDLLRHVASEGHIDRPAVSALPIEKIHHSVESYTHADEGVIIDASATEDGVRVKIQVKRQLADGREFLLVVNPTAERSQAIFREPEPEVTLTDSTGTDSKQTDVYYTATADGNGGMTIQNCSDACGEVYDRTVCSTTCGPYSCGCVKYGIHTSCTDPSCDGCYTIDYSCCGDYNCDL
ncbi:hypothetical protein [Halorussus caseinilyticus]|uniref:Twin-arginine translocation signal domain-containing protein n=1 Tax=Halorussus caseinilyticus TaxID=3034025 RepID=A0ABD5WRK3_9EURY|nr:hypothetical protein [Halorussus sp. DT72]